MAFVEKGWRSFLRTGDADPTLWRGRMAGQLMTYEACKDPRAWCLSVADRRQYLVDIMRRGPGDLDSTLLPPTDYVRDSPPRGRQPVEKKRSAASRPKLPVEEKVILPKGIGVGRVDFTKEEKLTTEETVDKRESEGTPGITDGRERRGTFCENLSAIANELEGILDGKSVSTHVPRLYEICSELAGLANECESMSAEMNQKYRMLEVARAVIDSDLEEELMEDYDNFDSTRFQADISQVRYLEEKLNALRTESVEDDAEETDEAWELRNIVAQLENKLEFYQDDHRSLPERSEGYSQTDQLSTSHESEPSARSYEPSERSESAHEESGSESSFPEKGVCMAKECEQLRATIDDLHRRIENLESDRQDRCRDMYEDGRDSITSRELTSITAERDSLVVQLNNFLAEVENLQQEKASLLLEADQMRQQLGEIQSEHLAALDYIKSLEESAAECQMLKEECKSREEELKQNNRERAKLHHEVHRLQCIIKDVEDDRKRTLNQLERLSCVADWAKVLQKVH